jgi:hypothetical protein
MIEWKNLDNSFIFLVGLPQFLLGLFFWSRQGGAALYPLLPLMVSCVVLPILVHMAASSHNPSGIKRIQSWVFFVTSNFTSFILILGWSVYSIGSLLLVILAYLITWGLVRELIRWSGIEMNKVKSMYIGVGRNLGFLIPIIIFIVTIVAEAGISPFQSLAITSFLLAFFYPVLLLASWVAILSKISSMLYKQQYSKTASVTKGRWFEALESSQPWGDLAVLTMVVGSTLANRRVIALLGLSLISLLSIIVTVPYLGAIGWLPIAIQCGAADVLLAAYLVSYLKLDRASLLQFMRL